MLTYGKRLKEERERMGLTQTALADIASVTKVTQINYEKDSRKPDIEYLELIKNAGVDILYVITGERGQGTKLSPDEVKLLNNYRHVSDDGKKMLLASSDALALTQQPQKKIA